MHSWSVFFLFNAVFTGLVGFSTPESTVTTAMKSLAAFSLLAFLLFAWFERKDRNGDV
jgi:hypothetical protein